jgi:4-diphosphocytidyl-2-C-methyl-D-erythritol kinase
MIAFPNAKINLGLYIIEKRTDGFHNIETIFVPIPKLCDILEILPMPNQTREMEFSQSGIVVDGDKTENLCVKAFNILKKHVAIPKVFIHLHKQIPMGAGLGGGSADGAFTLNLLNEMASNPLPKKELEKLALELGSDCPFFLTNKPCFGGGRGEIIEPIDIKIENFFIVLVNPGIHVHTGNAYLQSKPQPAPFNLKTLENFPVEKWEKLVSNDFEKVVFPVHPELKRIKEKLYELGAVYSSMSGSGSSVFGIFRKPPSTEGHFQGMFVHVSKL